MILIFLLIGVIVILYPLQNQKQTLRSKAADIEINTLDYFLTKHPDKKLYGPNGKGFIGDFGNQIVEGNRSYFVKWDPYSYEIHEWDDNYIYIKEDHSRGNIPAYYHVPGLWMKRKMKVGEKLDLSSNQNYYFKETQNNFCIPNGSQNSPYIMTLESHIPDYDLGGDLGRQDIIVLRFDYCSLSNGYEKYYYSKEWGWVGWEMYDCKTNKKADISGFGNKIRPYEYDHYRYFPDKASACRPGMQPASQSSQCLTVFPDLTLAPLEMKKLEVTFKNTGTTTWLPDSLEKDKPYRLGSAEPWDNFQWGAGTGRTLLSKSIPPGASYTFEVNLTAPETPGLYRARWQMVQDKVNWFGEVCGPTMVKVTGNPYYSSQCVAADMPTTLKQGEVKEIKIAMKNSSSSVWKKGGINPYRLGHVGGQDNNFPWLGRIDSDRDIPQGETYTYTFKIQAPFKTGTYSGEWQMVQDGVQWFGEKCGPQSVQVVNL